MKQLTLSEIWIYPIKSFGGISLRRAKVFQKGLQYDRRWMLIDDEGGFMTQRVYPHMALFKLSIERNQLSISFRERPDTPNPPSVLLDIEKPATGQSIRAKIWDDEVDTIEADPQLSAWMSQHLQMSCRLVSFPEDHPRGVDPTYQVNDEHVSLADAYPFLIIGQGSLDHLNMKLQEPLPMNRFRPNFVFTGGEPHEEDTWRNLTIGKNRFVAVKPCARCVLTTVNQQTAQKGPEPLVTLAKYRKQENKILFGQNLVAIDHVEVSVGDPITIN